MNRRSFFTIASSMIGFLSVSSLFKIENVLAAPPIKAKPGGKSGHAFADEESLKGLEKANGLTASNFWGEGDKIATVQNYCNAAIPKNNKCAPTRQAHAFCGNCTFIQNRVIYDGDVAGKCQLIPDQPPKTHVPGRFHCASWVENQTYKYKIKA